MKTVLLLGELGKQYGRKHRFDVKNAAEAVRALAANFPGFDRWMIDSTDRGVGYKVTVGKAALPSVEHLHDPCGENETIKITPVLMGAKSGIVPILIGTALIAAAFVTGGASIAATGFLAGGLTTTFWGGIAVGIGTSLILGGVAQMLAPQPKTIENKPVSNNPSYAFDGPVNVTSQGVPVPIGYGRMIVGSVVISGGIAVEDIAYRPPLEVGLLALWGYFNK